MIVLIVVAVIVVGGMLWAFLYDRRLKSRGESVKSYSTIETGAEDNRSLRAFRKFRR